MELEALDELYRDIILDHYKNPRHGNDVDNPDLESNGNNPFCGDEISLQLKLSHGRIVEIGFHGRGCSISQASGSIMAGAIEGKSLEEVGELAGTFRALMKGKDLLSNESDNLGELEALSGVREFPIRIKCALLGWSILEDGIKKYSSNKG